MALENPIAKLFKRCADAVKQRYGLSDDSTLDWRDMFAKIANIDKSDVDENCDGPVPLENYIDGMDVEDKLRFTLGQLPKAIRKRDFGSMNPAYGRIELRQIPHYIINTWTPDSYITFNVVDKYGTTSSYRVPTDSSWSYMTRNDTDFTSVTASDKTYVQYKYNGAFVYNNAGTYVSPNDTIIENTTYYSYEGITTFTVRIATSKSNTDTVSVTFNEEEIAKGITWKELANTATTKVRIEGTSVTYNYNTIYEPSETQNNAVSPSDTINTSSTYRTYRVSQSTGTVFYVDNQAYECAENTTWSSLDSTEVLGYNLYEITDEYSGYAGGVSPFSTGRNDSNQYVVVIDLDNDTYALWSDKIRNGGNYKVMIL